jgi:hypothetical protein
LGTEKDLYPIVEKWMKKQFACFKTGINTGLKHSRIDVAGVRDIGNDLSGEVETIAIEVKKGNEPFATAAGQAFGYSIYANRVYLADMREKPFDYEHKKIATRLGVGLIQVDRKGSCKEILTSPVHSPLAGYKLLLLEKMALGKCQICESVFELGGSKKYWSNIVRKDLDKAIEKEKGLAFWNIEVANRKKKLGLRNASNGLSYERRFICPDCIWNIFSVLYDKSTKSQS